MTRSAAGSPPGWGRRSDRTAVPAGRLLHPSRAAVLIAWILFAVGITLIANATGRPTSDDTTIPGSDSTAATDLLEAEAPLAGQRLGADRARDHRGQEAHPGRQPERRQGDRQGAEGQRVRALACSTRCPSRAQTRSPSTRRSGSSASTSPSAAATSTTRRPSRCSTRPPRPATPGSRSRRAATSGSQLSSPSTRLSEIVGIVAAMIVLVFVLGTVLSMVMPITTALAGVFSGLGLIGVARRRARGPVDRADARDHARASGSGSTTRCSSSAATGRCSTAAWSYKRGGRPRRRDLRRRRPVRRQHRRDLAALPVLRRHPAGPELGYSAAIAVAVVIVASLTMLPAGLSLLGRAHQRAAGPPARARGGRDRSRATRTAGRVGRRGSAATR